MPDQPERSLSDEPTETPVATASASPLGTPNPPANGTPPVVPPAVSIVDTILDLDELLSADVRRAEKTARFCTKPDLEADIEELIYELDGLTDDQGNALPTSETDDEQGRTAYHVAFEIQTLQAEYGAAFRSVRMRQLSSDDWKEFRSKWREVIGNPGLKPNEFYNDLIEVSSFLPNIPAAVVQQLRAKLGDPQMDAIAQAAWDVNTNSGVSIPKSPLSSRVLRQAVRSQS